MVIEHSMDGCAVCLDRSVSSVKTDCTHTVDLLMTVSPSIECLMTMQIALMSPLALALHMLLFVPPVFSPFLFVLIFVFFCLFRRPV